MRLERAPKDRPTPRIKLSTLHTVTHRYRYTTTTVSPHRHTSTTTSHAVTSTVCRTHSADPGRLTLDNLQGKTPVTPQPRHTRTTTSHSSTSPSTTVLLTTKGEGCQLHGHTTTTSHSSTLPSTTVLLTPKGEGCQLYGHTTTTSHCTHVVINHSANSHGFYTIHLKMTKYSNETEHLPANRPVEFSYNTPNDDETL